MSLNSDDNILQQGVGTGHGGTLAFTDPTAVDVHIDQRSPLNHGKPFGALGLDPRDHNYYLIRDLTLHTDTGAPFDVTHMGSTESREYAPYDLYAPGQFSFTVLFNNEVANQTDNTNGFYDYPLPGMRNTYDRTAWPTGAASGGQPFRLSTGPIRIMFPLRNPDNDTPAYLSSWDGTQETPDDSNLGIRAKRGAFVVQRQWGALGTNAVQACRVTMQWMRPPFWSEETITP